jgi:hypothetical protein
VNGAIGATAAVTITNSTLSDNSAAANGGALFNDLSATATVTSSTFTQNTTAIGGAIDNLGDLIISKSDFTENTADAGNQEERAESHVCSRPFQHCLHRTECGPTAAQGGIEGRNVAQLLRALLERRRRLLAAALGFQPAPDDALNMFLGSHDEEPVRSHHDQERDHEGDQNESH